MNPSWTLASAAAVGPDSGCGPSADSDFRIRVKLYHKRDLAEQLGAIHTKFYIDWATSTNFRVGSESIEDSFRERPPGSRRWSFGIQVPGSQYPRKVVVREDSKGRRLWS